MTQTAVFSPVESLELDCVPWPVEGEHSERIYPVPGTWTLAPEPLMKKGIRGLISCPHCHKACAVPYNMGQMENGALQLQNFQCSGCKLLRHVRLREWDTRKLYCIAYEMLDQKTGMPLVNSDGDFVRKEYTHALSRNEAFEHFVEVRKHYGRFRLIDVGEVVGFWGKESDKDQKELSV